MAINQKMNIGQTLRLHHGEAKKRHKVGVLDTHGERRKGLRYTTSAARPCSYILSAFYRNGQG